VDAVSALVEERGGVVTCVLAGAEVVATVGGTLATCSLELVDLGRSMCVAW
jgi:hypothetical protein